MYPPFTIEELDSVPVYRSTRALIMVHKALTHELFDELEKVSGNDEKLCELMTIAEDAILRIVGMTNNVVD